MGRGCLYLACLSMFLTKLEPRIYYAIFFNLIIKQHLCTIWRGTSRIKFTYNFVNTTKYLTFAAYVFPSRFLGTSYLGEGTLVYSGISRPRIQNCVVKEEERISSKMEINICISINFVSHSRYMPKISLSTTISCSLVHIGME
jgi:hypothetical protein